MKSKKKKRTKKNIEEEDDEGAISELEKEMFVLFGIPADC